VRANVPGMVTVPATGELTPTFVYEPRHEHDVLPTRAGERLAGGEADLAQIRINRDLPADNCCYSDG